MSIAIGRRRYLTNFEPHRLPHLFTDVLVLGAGAAGLQAALHAAEHADVVVVAKGNVTESATAYAQGGIAAAVAADDTVAEHAADTLAVGCELCHVDVVRQATAEAPELIRQLVAWGAKFDGDGVGLSLGREGAHSHSRIIHAHDATGIEILRTLLRKAREHPRIRIFENCFAIDLLTRDGHAVGVVTSHPKHGHQMFWATTTILATGGCGCVYRETSNPSLTTGDGLAMAFRAGAVLRDMEMIQFHPTTLYVAGAARALLSEAVRGDGAYLINREGRRFMLDYDERAELAPRDVVSRAITAEMKRENSPCVFLDVRHFPPGRFADRFPNLDRLCRDFDIHPERDRIPVRPSAHYTVGGVLVNEQGETAVPGLLACGEVTDSGLHGANRLASNSLLEALVFGRRTGLLAAERTARCERISTPPAISHILPPSPRTRLDLPDVRNSLTSLMSRNAAVERSGDRLRETLEIIDFWARYVMDKVFNEPQAWETQNMLTVAAAVALAASTRSESRGVHFRTDFPKTLPEWRCHIDLVRADETTQVATSPVPGSGPSPSGT